MLTDDVLDGRGGEEERVSVGGVCVVRVGVALTRVTVPVAQEAAQGGIV